MQYYVHSHIFDSLSLDQIMSQTVDISGIDKVQLLRALWEKSLPASFFNSGLVPPPQFDETKARELDSWKIDYFCGRCIKSNLSENSVDPRLYDRDIYSGAFAEVVAKLRGKV